MSFIYFLFIVRSRACVRNVQKWDFKLAFCAILINLKNESLAERTSTSRTTADPAATVLKAFNQPKFKQLQFLDITRHQPSFNWECMIMLHNYNSTGM